MSESTSEFITPKLKLSSRWVEWLDAIQCRLAVVISAPDWRIIFERGVSDETIERTKPRDRLWVYNMCKTMVETIGRYVETSLWLKIKNKEEEYILSPHVVATKTGEEWTTEKWPCPKRVIEMLKEFVCGTQSDWLETTRTEWANARLGAKETMREYDARLRDIKRRYNEYRGGADLLTEANLRNKLIDDPQIRQRFRTVVNHLCYQFAAQLTAEGREVPKCSSWIPDSIDYNGLVTNFVISEERDAHERKTSVSSGSEEEKKCC
jgi:hypothetical protein